MARLVHRWSITAAFTLWCEACCIKSAHRQQGRKVGVADYGVVQNFFGVGSAPVVEGDLLLAQVGGSPKDERLDPDQKNNGTALVAFDKLTGKVKYKVGDDLASYSVPTLATIEGKRWCFLLVRSGLLGIDPAAGKVRFTFPWKARNFESVNAADPIVIGDKVFITETYGPGSAMLRIKGDVHEVVWKDDERARRKAMQCHWNTPIHVNGYIYGSSGRHTQMPSLAASRPRPPRSGGPSRTSPAPH